MDFVLFGIQGSGKGTQSKFLAEKFNLKIFEMGGQLRILAQEDSELGKKIKNIIEAGHLVPTDVVMEIIENFLKIRMFFLTGFQDHLNKRNSSTP